jgi:hypothetical protein
MLHELLAGSSEGFNGGFNEEEKEDCAAHPEHSGKDMDDAE